MLKVKTKVKVYNITDSILDVFDLPLCPLCDQPITDMDYPAIGSFEYDRATTICLIHDCCGVHSSEDKDV